MTKFGIPSYNTEPIKVINIKDKTISCFLMDGDNIEPETVRSFGKEWSRFKTFTDEEIEKIGRDYFDLLEDKLYPDMHVLDVGCGTGRWARFLSSKVGFIDCIDPSDAVLSAAHLLNDIDNSRIAMAEVSTIPFEDHTFDLVYSLGVLHHVPDTKKGIADCVRKVRPGGLFLVYLYYNLDNRGSLYRRIFTVSNVLRRSISKLPDRLKNMVADAIAAFIYLPFVGLSKFLNLLGLNNLVKKLPLNYYAKTSWNIIRNDALDRFGTPLEKRFSKTEIRNMLADAGLHEIKFSDHPPYWHAIGRKKD